MSIKLDLNAIDKRLKGGKLWTQGWGEPTDPTQPTCLHGAIRYCQPVPGDAYLIEQVAERRGWGTLDNDLADSWRDLRVKVPAEVTDADLAETFGPQWEAIVALVRRAAVLTAREGARLTPALGDALGDALDAAGEAARHAARKAARDAARKAAGDAAWATTRASAWHAARDAARALSVRDLIGQYGFTQEHYDALTEPWASVIGPVHPDDKPVASS